MRRAPQISRREKKIRTSPPQETLFHKDGPSELPQRAISRNCAARFHVVPSTLPFAFPTFPFSSSFDFHLTDTGGRRKSEKVHKEKSCEQKSLEKVEVGEEERQERKKKKKIIKIIYFADDIVVTESNNRSLERSINLRYRLKK